MNAEYLYSNRFPFVRFYVTVKHGACDDVADLVSRYVHARCFVCRRYYEARFFNHYMSCAFCRASQYRQARALRECVVGGTLWARFKKRVKPHMYLTPMKGVHSYGGWNAYVQKLIEVVQILELPDEIINHERLAKYLVTKHNKHVAVVPQEAYWLPARKFQMELMDHYKDVIDTNCAKWYTCWRYVSDTLFLLEFMDLTMDVPVDFRPGYLRLALDIQGWVTRWVRRNGLPEWVLELHEGIYYGEGASS